MVDLLHRYREKRDFATTPEPKGKAAKTGRALSYVIQKHAARRLHYDFRLELDGALKSWAVPKGPSLDPNDKRMAVHVEDHPLEYGKFEGVIPPKQYGAGTVIVWDRGTWEPLGDPREGYRAGKLKFELHGEKLKGHWTLVRMHGRAAERQEPWLLIKERDDEARPASEYSIVDELPDSVLSGTSIPAQPAAKKKAASAKRTSESKPEAGTAELPAGAKPADLPLSLAPQLATLVDRAPAGEDWIYEIKFDGYRLLTRIDGDDVRLFTRNGNDWTSKMKSLATAIQALKLPPGWLDGEIIVPGEHGAPDFNALQNAFDASRTEQIEYFLFDIPYFAGHDLRSVGVAERRELLRQLMKGASSPRLRFSEDFHAKPDEILRNACKMRLEGVIGKRRDAPYVSRRATSWIKLKCTQRQEFVIAGYTDPAGSRIGIGALLLAIHDDSGKLRYAGRVGTGFDSRTLKALKEKLTPLAADKTPLADAPADAKGHWVKPKLVAEVSFSEWTPDHRVRHAIFHGLRSDKPASAIGIEAALPASELATEPDKESKKTPAPKASTTSSKKPAIELPGDIRVSHPERVIDKATGLTKLDLVNHYLHVARRMLPHLEGRPLAVLRAPSGIDGQLFFQKHGGTLHIPEITHLDPALDPGHPAMMEIDSFTALIGAAQMNVIEFHTWNATTRNIEKPDRMTFDLDPGEGVAWPAMREAAELTHALLDEIGLVSFLKTSGGKGLHIVVPLTPRDDWDTVKGFSQAVVQHLARVLPTRFVAKSGARNRVGKIFVDYLRNGRGATTVAAFSARARPGLGVSIPCAWDELHDLQSADQWTIANADERLESNEDPWASYAKTRQTLTAAMKKLNAT
ncbi:MAG: DNA ligase D [Betaproteobacteria bacterium]|nr:MAG: DNA ligase D [Betaproteobacteria bacterium]